MKYRCPGRLVDVTGMQFESWMPDDKDKHLKSFLGMVANGHLYYTEDERLIKSISASNKHVGLNDGITTYEKAKKTKKQDKVIEVLGKDNLDEEFEKKFKEDMQLRYVKLQDGKITRIDYGDTTLLANPELSIMKELGEEHTESVTGLAQKGYDFTDVDSHFMKDCYDILTVHGGIVGSFNEPTGKPIVEYDFNKMRTDCWMNNNLGPYEVFEVYDEPQPFTELKKAGWYYVETDENTLKFYMRGNNWYSLQFIKAGERRGFFPKITHQWHCSKTLPQTYFKCHVSKIVKKYPNHFKHIINRQIGLCGKTTNKKKIGWLETDEEMALASFWNNNPDGIGMIEGKRYTRQRWRMMDGQIPTITEDYIAGQRVFKTEITKFSTRYSNQVPIYNKVLENEYLRVYDLIQEVGGRLIKIKTDAILVEGGKDPKNMGNKIGQVKKCKITEEVNWIDRHPNTEPMEWYHRVNWNTTYESENGLPPMPAGSVLITGLAGFGKSYVLKHLPQYDEDTTIRVAFTNVATENISDETHPASTLNSCFGIDFESGNLSEKKVRNLKNCKTIMISECFMIPAYIMHALSLIKSKFPEIQFICEGDPEQTRPIGEEHINWYNTLAFNKICDGNEIKLTINKRSNETENYYTLINGGDLPEKHGFREPQSINITRTNKTRKEINNQMMDKSGYKIKQHKSNDYGQDMWLTLDTPIMCVKTDKKKNLKNGKMFELKEIEKDKIKIGDNVFTDSEFSLMFVPAYAVTNHKVQGLTIKVPFNIYDWKQMSSREKYTAYSRTVTGDVVICS